MNPLQLFYNDKIMRDTVKEFLLINLKDLAVETVFNKKDIVGIFEAKKVIDNSFEKLEELFMKKGKPIINSSR